MTRSLTDSVIPPSTRGLLYRGLSFSDKQHELIKLIMGAYPEPMAEVMADDTPGETKAVLDLGCGSGSWSGCFFLTLRVTRIGLTTFQDNGGGSRLSPLSGCRRRFGPHAIYVSGLGCSLTKIPGFELISAVICHQIAGIVSLLIYQRRVRSPVL